MSFLKIKQRLTRYLHLWEHCEILSYSSYSIKKEQFIFKQWITRTYCINCKWLRDSCLLLLHSLSSLSFPMASLGHCSGNQHSSSGTVRSEVKVQEPWEMWLPCIRKFSLTRFHLLLALVMRKRICCGLENPLCHKGTSRLHQFFQYYGSKHRHRLFTLDKWCFDLIVC